MILNQILLKKEKKTNQIYNLQGSKIDLLNWYTLYKYT
jgi:hypothetical protein